MVSQPALNDVLVHYPPLEVSQVQPLGGAGGFSGASFWKLQSSAGPLCLRRWPREHPSPQRLQQIHRVLRHLHSRGCTFVPVPFPTRQGETFAGVGGDLWELSSWMPGVADFSQDPSPAKLQAAMEALASIHVAAAELRWDEQTPQLGPSPGLQQRLARIEALQGELGVRLRAAVHSRRVPELDEEVHRLLELFPRHAFGVTEQLRREAGQPVPLQICLRDIWHDHLLFSGEKLTGVVDFGAMRPDHKATDLARLLGSLLGDQMDLWATALDFYRVQAPLDRRDEQLLSVFDRSLVLLSGFSWIEWIYAEQRQFESLPAIRTRLQQCLIRLERW